MKVTAEKMGKMERTKKNKISVICHNIRSAYNIGSIFRTADGAGVAKLYLTGYTPAPPHSGISKTALGAEKSVEWEKYSRIENIFRKLKQDKTKIIAIEQDPASKPYDHFDFKGKICLVLGNEKRGLSKAVLKKCDEILEIPMKGEKESLNVSVAFGIAIYSIIDKSGDS